MNFLSFQKIEIPFDHGSIWQLEALKQYHESFYTIIYDIGKKEKKKKKKWEPPQDNNLK